MGTWTTISFRTGTLHQHQSGNPAGHHVLTESGLVSFGPRLGPHVSVVKSVAGVGGGARSARTFFINFGTLRNRKESSRTLAITVSVCQSHTSFSWHRGFAASELSRSICFSPCRSLVIERVTGAGWRARTCAARGDACLRAAARRRLETRRFIWLRTAGMRRWWSSFWIVLGWTLMRRTR